MDEAPIPLPGPDRRLWPWLLALLLVAGGLRAWQFASTEVATRDSISFIRVAWMLENRPLGQTLRSSKQHPLYPAVVLATSWAVRPFHPGDLPLAMQRSAQLASCAASLALVLVLFFLGRELFSTAVGFWAALCYQFLPSPGRLMADGLSEPVFLAFAGLGMLAAVRGLRGKHPAWLALAGLCSGLAYLTRPEGLVIAAAALPLLLLHRRCWADAARRAAFLLVPLLLAVLPYMVTIGGLTVKPMAGYFVDPGKWENEGHFKPPAKAVAAAVASPLQLAEWYFGQGITANDRWLWALRATCSAADGAFFPGGIALVLFGAWMCRQRFAADAGFGFVGLLSLAMLALSYRVAQSNGYISPRHLVMPALTGTCFLVVGMAGLARRLWQRRAAALAAAGLCAVMAACAPKVLAPLHADRAAYRKAGEWIAAHAAPGDRVFDPYAHAYYHAGRVFTEGDPAPKPGATYVILEKSIKPHSHLGYLVQHAQELSAQGTEVCRFRLPKERGAVVVYRVRNRAEG